MAESTTFQKKDFKNIIDYVYENGGLKFTEKEFNVLDNAVFSAFSYIPFELFEKQNDDFKPKKLSEICLDFFDWIDINYLAEHFPDWLRRSIFLAMAIFRKKRYANCLVTDFRYEFSEKESTQFGALNILLKDETSAVVFRGTDNSILGWKEDFNLACYESVRGQLSAKKFLKEMMNKFPERSFRVMGHSKGGNLAVYSACFLSKSKADRLIRIYSNDGPGMSEEVFFSKGHKAIKNKITHLIVGEDIVGRLLCHEEAEYVVKSAPEKDFVMQHDLFNWHVEGDGFVKLPRISSESKYLTDSVNEWLKESIPDSIMREELVRCLFEAEEKTGIQEAGVILANPKKFIFDFLRKTKELEKDERKLINKAFTSLVMKMAKNYPSYLKDKSEAANAMKEEKKEEELALSEVKVNVE